MTTGTTGIAHAHEPFPKAPTAQRNRGELVLAMALCPDSIPGERLSGV